MEAAATKPRRTPRTRKFPSVKLETLTATVAVSGALLYFVLSLLYQRFYAPLGIQPEDVGLDRTAVVARALGGVVAIGVATLGWGLFQLLVELIEVFSPAFAGEMTA